MSRSMKRVSFVTCDPDFHQVAFVAHEPELSGRGRPLLCHTFRLESAEQAVRISSVLNELFGHSAIQPNACFATEKTSEKVASRNITIDDPRMDPFPTIVPADPTTANDRTGRSRFRAKSVEQRLRPQSLFVSNSPAVGFTPDRSKRMSTTLLKRIFGAGGVRNGGIENVANRRLVDQSTNELAQPTLIDGDSATNQRRRRRRPVSAVFSSAFHRLSACSSSSHLNVDKLGSSQTPTKKSNCNDTSESRRNSIHYLSQSCVSVSQEDGGKLGRMRKAVELAGNEQLLGTGCGDQCRRMTPMYSCQTSEWLLPIDDQLERILRLVPWYCGETERNLVVDILRRQPDGSFVVRKSLSHSCCLALSVKVPSTHNPRLISHYLILRTIDGFRLKGFHKHFPSVQTLVTHHSVMAEQLPCRLLFANLSWAEPMDKSKHDYDSPCSDSVYGP